MDGNLSACTVGSLTRRIRMESLLQFIREIVDSEEPEKKLDALEEALKTEVFDLSPSSKHMSGRRLGRLEPTASLKYKKAA